MAGMRTTTLTLFGIAALLIAISVALALYAGVDPATAIVWTLLSSLSISFDLLPQNTASTPVILAATTIDAFVFALLTVVLATLFFDFIKSFDFRRKLAARRIKKMKDHVIVVPENPFAHAVSKELREANIPHVIISDQEDEARRLYRVNELALVGDPRSIEVYINANVAKARCVVACGEDDTLNALIAITAKDVAPEIKVISRTSNIDDFPKLGKAGATRIIMPEVSAGEELGNELVKRAFSN